MKIRPISRIAQASVAVPLVTLFLALPFATGQDKTPAAGDEKPPASAEEAAKAGDSTDADVENLAKAAERFVEAYNKKDAAAIAALFVPEGELIDRDGGVTRGREDILARYKEIFDDESVPKVALEASKVRMLGPGVVLEDGTLHFTATEEKPVRSIRYSALQLRQPDGTWLIASTRDLEEVTPPSERIKGLERMEGDWMVEIDGTQMDLSFKLDDSGNFLIGEALVTTAKDEPQSSSIRIGWNPACSSVCWWAFDSDGGNCTGTWTPVGEEWLIHSSGVTSDGETTGATQKLSFQGKDTLVWSVRDKVIDGEVQPDVTLRFVRRAPEVNTAAKEEEAADKSKE